MLGTEGTLLRRMLALATRPSPLAASHTPRELAAAAIAIVQQLAAHVNGKKIFYANFNSFADNMSH